jgi:ADP-heptose:LPS heptosyltransferase
MARPPRRTRAPAFGKPRKLILRNFLAPGDLVMLTAAVRDLHRSYPGQFITDVRTSCPDLWLHNSHVSRLSERDRDVEVIDCEYPLINRSNEAPFHCIHGFVHFLNERLGLRIQPHAFGGDIHLSREEKSWRSQVAELAGAKVPFWLVVSGGKFDYTAKWWDPRRFQHVVDHFRGRIQFVQIGEIGHHHPRLHGTVDLRGRTELRELIRLVYHAQGVVCGVTALMHLAAAVETYPTRPKLRPAVIIAGGREPSHWEAYPNHQFIHNVGGLPCCEMGGCWRSRVKPIGDDEKHDQPANLCANVVGSLPKCMDMISAGDVIRRIESFFVGGMTRYLKPSEMEAARRAVRASERPPTFDSTFNIITARKALRDFSKQTAPPAPEMQGNGIVICGAPDSLDAFVRKVRRRSPLPIHCYTQAPVSLSDCGQAVQLTVVPQEQALLAYALEHSRSRNIVVFTEPRSSLLRSDFEACLRTQESRESAACFWPRPRRAARRGLWRMCGMEPPVRAIDSGVAVIDRERCWRALHLWRRLCEHRYLFVDETGSELGALYFALCALKQTCLLMDQHAPRNAPGQRINLQRRGIRDRSE